MDKPCYVMQLSTFFSGEEQSWVENLRAITLHFLDSEHAR